MSRFAAALRGDIRGATIVEFAMVAPVLLMTVMGIFDLGYNMYTTSMLQGAIQQAARKATIEGSSVQSTLLDKIVGDAVHAVVPGAAMTFTRKSYSSFSKVGKPEDYTDVNGDGICNGGEPFEDANRNGGWDRDRGRAGHGGARDAVLYTVDVTYPRAFPIAPLIGMSPTFTAQAKTVLRNQPYNLQDLTVATGNCP